MTCLPRWLSRINLAAIISQKKPKSPFSSKKTGSFFCTSRLGPGGAWYFHRHQFPNHRWTAGALAAGHVSNADLILVPACPRRQPHFQPQGHRAGGINQQCVRSHTCNLILCAGRQFPDWMHLALRSRFEQGRATLPGYALAWNNLAVQVIALLRREGRQKERFLLFILFQKNFYRDIILRESGELIRGSKSAIYNGRACCQQKKEPQPKHLPPAPPGTQSMRTVHRLQVSNPKIDNHYRLTIKYFHSCKHEFL